MKKTDVTDKRDHNFFIIYNDLIDSYGSIIGSGGVAVYSVLCRFMNNKSRRCWPSYETMGELLCLSPKTVGKYIDLLEKHKLINIVKWENGSVKKYEIVNLHTPVKITGVQVKNTNEKLSTTPVKITGDLRKNYSGTHVKFTGEQYEENNTKELHANVVEKKLLKFLEKQESIHNPLAFISSIKKRYGTRNLDRLLTIEFGLWKEHLEYWSKSSMEDS